MNNFKLIKSIISLILLSLVFVTTTFAWFATNSSTDANGINGQTKYVDFSGGTINRYLAIKDYEYNDDSSIKEENYTLGQDIDKNNITLEGYDLLYDNVDYVIYEISILSNTNKTLKLKANNDSVSNKITYDSTSKTYQNYLSNVCDFYYLGTDSSKLKVQEFSDNSEKKNFGYITEDERKNIIDLFDVESNSSVTTYYLLFKYNGTYIKQLYEDNENVTFDQVYFIDDLYFYLEDSE